MPTNVDLTAATISARYANVKNINKGSLSYQYIYDVAAADGSCPTDLMLSTSAKNVLPAFADIADFKDQGDVPAHTLSGLASATDYCYSICVVRAANGQNPMTVCDKGKFSTLVDLSVVRACVRSPEVGGDFGTVRPAIWLILIVPMGAHTTQHNTIRYTQFMIDGGGR